VKHLVGLIDNGKSRQGISNEHVKMSEPDLLDPTHREDVRPVHEIDKATGRGDQDVATLAKFLNVVAKRNAAVAADGTEHRTVAEATSLVEDLLSELASRTHDDDKRLSANPVNIRVVVGRLRVRTGALKLLHLSHELAEDGNQVRSSFS